MADIFISYAKSDRFLAIKLSALLEGSGYTTWWDRHLDTAVRYREQIMLELEKARAVVVIWTEASVESDWVRAEAGRAHQQRKLIPLRTAEVGYAAIPLPFGELHTADFTDEGAILHAIKTRLLTPEVPASAVRIFLASLGHELLLWLAILAGALTLISHAQAFFSLSNGCRWLVSNWAHLNQSLWGAIFFFAFKVSAYDAALLTTFALITASLFSSSTRGAMASPSETPWRLKLALLVVGVSVLLSFKAVLNELEARAGARLEAYVSEAFPSNPHCKGDVFEYAQRYMDGTFIARLVTGSISKADLDENGRLSSSFDACLKFGTVDKDKLWRLASRSFGSHDPGEWLWRDPASLPSVGLTIVFASEKFSPIVLLLLLPVAMPFCIYAYTRQFSGLSLDVTKLSRHLWRLIALAFALVCINYVALAIEHYEAATNSARLPPATQAK